MAELDENFVELEHGIDETQEKSEPELIQENEVGSVTGGSENRWPGWPGENVFRMLVPGQKVGTIIGRKGENIKKLSEETRARIKILDGPPGTLERAVMISAKEEPDSSLPPAIDALLRVHKRVLDGLEDDTSHNPPGMGGKVSTKLLVPATQAGSLIGKLGTTVKSIQEASSCIVRVLEDVPIFALQDDRIVEIVGEPAGIHKAIELIASHLRKFLLDRSIIPMFELQNPNHRTEQMPPQQSWGPPPHAFPPNANAGPGYGASPHFVPAPRQVESYYPPADIPPQHDSQLHQGISSYGREAPLAVQAVSSAQSVPTVITQITQQMQIPLSYADSVIGSAGSHISNIRRASGATVTIQETRGVPGEMTVEMSGTASQVQTAQQLIQNYMAEAATPLQSQPNVSADQGYNSYPSQGASMYASPPNTGYQGKAGGYSSAYGANYGYQ